MTDQEKVADMAAGKKGKKKGGKDRAPPAADVLILLARQNANLFHDSSKVAYATTPAGTAKVRSRLFRTWLAGLFYSHSKGHAANSEAMSVAVSSVEAIAIHDSPERPVYVRLAEHGGCIYLNLADADETIIRVGPSGWSVDAKPPVRFLATNGSSPMPMPERGGSIAELRRFINCPDDDSFSLLCGFISASFRADGPFPLMLLVGEQGSAKSTTGRILKELTDPEKVRDRSAPRDLRDLAIWAGGSRLLCVDNISSFPDWLSDGFCRLATGGGFGTRTLYADDEETIFDARRPVVLNGIDDFATRGDLLERSIILRHPPIPEGKRRLETELWREFHEAKPRLLGAILDRVVAGLKSLPNVDTTKMPRMADAAAFAVACEAGMGEPSRFLEAFRQNQSDSHELMLADSPIVDPIRKLVTDSGGKWSGTASELYAAIKPSGDKLPAGWPKQPSGLSGSIRRLAPALAKCYSLIVAYDRLPGDKRTRIVRLEIAGGNFPESASGPSRTVPPVPKQDHSGTTGTTRDGQNGTFGKYSASQRDLEAIKR